MVSSWCCAVSINEVRTDHFGVTDTEEYFELAGTPGESLDDFLQPGMIGGRRNGHQQQWPTAVGFPVFVHRDPIGCLSQGPHVGSHLIVPQV